MEKIESSTQKEKEQQKQEGRKTTRKVEKLG